MNACETFLFVHTCRDNRVPDNVRKGISDPLILVDEEYIDSSQYGIQSKKLIYMQTYTKLIFSHWRRNRKMAKMGELKTNVLSSIRRRSSHTGKRTETREWPAKLEMRDQHARHQTKYSHTSPKPRVIIYFRNKYN